jgi:hypothetical protein
MRSRQIGWSQESNLLYQILRQVNNLTKQLSVKCSGRVPNTSPSGAIPPRQIGWSNESELLWEISKELNRTIAVAGTCGNPYLYTMKTFTDYDTPGYPVGVFNLDGDYVGIANDQSEYVTVWNSDPVNSAVTTISAGLTPTQFISNSAIINPLYGLRFYSANITTSGSVRVFGGPETRAKFGTSTPVSVSTGVLTTNPFGTFFGIPRCIPAVSFYYLQYAYTGASTLTVFHNEDDVACGIDYASNFDGFSVAKANVTNLTGTFPEKVQTICYSPKNAVADNTIISNISNFNQLTEVINLSYLIWNAGPLSAALPVSINHMSKLKQFSSYYNDNRLGALNVFDKNYFPDMEAIFCTTNISSIGVTSLANVSPKLRSIAYSGGAAMTTPIYDQLVIDLNNALPVFVPGVDSTTRLQLGNGTRSSASDVARTSLIAKGFGVAFA